MAEYTPGTPSWVDLSTEDIDASLGFYGELFGWTATPAVAEFGGYRNFLDAGAPVAGVFPIEAGSQPIGWRSYVCVDDSDAAAARVAAAGGAIVIAPLAIGELGTMGVYVDAIGAQFGTWQPGEHRGAGKVNEPVSLTWNELTCTSDKAPAASEFYGSVFGWTAETADMGGMDYTTFNLGDRGVAGMIGIGDPSHAGLPSFWNVYFAVEDCDATLANAIALGGSKIRSPTDIPTGRFAVVNDPHGAPFSVIALSSAS